jgi:hypothetical protein
LACGNSYEISSNLKTGAGGIPSFVHYLYKSGEVQTLESLCFGVTI